MPLGELQESLRLRESLPLTTSVSYRGEDSSTAQTRKESPMMKRLGRAFAFALTLAGLLGAPAWAEEVRAGDLVITQPWSRATPGGAKVGGGYVTIENKGSTPDRLVGASGDIAGKIEVHEMAVTNGVMTMRPLDQGLPIEPGKTVKLAPGGYHLMMLDLKSPLKQGDKVPVTLEFEKAGKVKLTLEVEGVGAQGPAGGGMDGMDMKKMPPGMKM